MAILHQATLTPGKLELIEAWLDRQSWGGAGELTLVGAYRFDDPEGEVGVEAFVVRRAEQLLHVALTYRAAPHEGSALVGTTEHSVLGTRWVYDATTDPVALGCFERALKGEQEQAILEVWDQGRLVERREPTTKVRVEDGEPSTPGLRLADRLEPALTGARRLVAGWDGGEAVVAALD